AQSDTQADTEAHAQTHPQAHTETHAKAEAHAKADPEARDEGGGQGDPEAQAPSDAGRRSRGEPLALAGTAVAQRVALAVRVVRRDRRPGWRRRQPRSGRRGVRR